MPNRTRRAISSSNHPNCAAFDEGERDWLARVGKRVVVMGDCWVVDGKRDTYPDGAIGGVMELLHRAVYAEMHPDKDITDLHVHHECQCPGCINPAHLLALTPAEHAARHRVMRAA